MSFFLYVLNDYFKSPPQIFYLVGAWGWIVSGGNGGQVLVTTSSMGTSNGHRRDVGIGMPQGMVGYWDRQGNIGTSGSNVQWGCDGRMIAPMTSNQWGSNDDGQDQHRRGDIGIGGAAGRISEGNIGTGDDLYALPDYSE